MKLDASLPGELKGFFNPIPEKLDSVYNAARFQYTTMAGGMEYYRRANQKLNDKLMKQKELLYAAKDELTQLDHYKKKVFSLSEEVAILKSQLLKNAPPTAELDFDHAGSMGFEGNDIDPGTHPSHKMDSFIEKFHRNTIPKPSITPVSLSATSSGNDASHSFRGESTNIQGLRSSSSSRHSNDEPPVKKPSLFRTAKIRSATTQLASRISANMKVGPTNDGGNSLRSLYAYTDVANKNAPGSSLRLRPGTSSLSDSRGRRYLFLPRN